MAVFYVSVDGRDASDGSERHPFATLERAVAEAAATGTGFHFHAAEAESDQEYNLREHGCRVIERFHRAGVLGPSSLAAHCVHVDGREMDLLAGTGTAVAHNPQSNLNNAVGIAAIAP